MLGEQHRQQRQRPDRGDRSHRLTFSHISSEIPGDPSRPEFVTSIGFAARPIGRFSTALRTASRLLLNPSPALGGKRFKTDFPVAERDEWERWYEARCAEAAKLRSRISDSEGEINERVYALCGFDKDEIAAAEEALKGQY